MATITVARVYQQSFQAHPNTTLAFTGGTLNALGDLVAQRTQNAVSLRLVLPHYLPLMLALDT